MTLCVVGNKVPCEALWGGRGVNLESMALTPQDTGSYRKPLRIMKIDPDPKLW